MSERCIHLPILMRSRSLFVLVVLAWFLTGTPALSQESNPAPIRVPPPSNHAARLGATGSPASGPLHSSGWWLGTSGIALLLAACGAICIAARRYRPQDSTALVRVVGRVSLSPRHSIFMVRAGRRLLLIGAGNQGAPTLLGELDEEDEIGGEADGAAGQAQEVREGPRGAATAFRTTQGLDVLLGEEE